MLEFKNVSKIYKTDSSEEFYALKDFSYTFSNKGMYFIEGKSGSGKSTISNLAALFDKPSKGEIFFKSHNINKWKQKRIDYYHAKDISVIFQHYNLLNEETVMFNVLLPTFSFNKNKSKSKIKAKELLNKVGIKENQFNQHAKDLSGGEMQRVAIARALINDPSMIIADEPTGALDEENSVIIMDLLKAISKEKLVIIISHNVELVNHYADYKITLKDGKRINRDLELKKEEIINKEKEIKVKNGIDDSWIIKSAFKRLKKNITKNFLIFISLVFSFCFLVSMVGFILGSSIMSNEISYHRIDYGNASLSHTQTKHINNSSLSLQKMTKVSKDELINMEEIYDSFYITNCYDYLIPLMPQLVISNLEFDQITFNPIYSFKDTYTDESLLLEGKYPSSDKGVVINSLANEKIKEKLKLKTSIGQIITLNIVKEIEIQTYGSVNVSVNDTFVYDKSFIITGVVDEFSFLSSPKIFYSLKQLEEELQMNIMSNLSYALNKEITYFDYIDNAKEDSEISSYKHHLFFKDKNTKLLKDKINYLSQLYDVDIMSESIMITDTFNELMSAAIFGVSLFVLIALIGSLLILGIASFSSYVFEKRSTAIMYAFGINKEKVSSIFLIENILVTSFSFIISLLLSPLLINGLNSLIFNIFGLTNLIINPLQKWTFSIVFIVVCVFLLINTLVYLFTITPIEIGGKVKIKEELSDE